MPLKAIDYRSMVGFRKSGRVKPCRLDHHEQNNTTAKMNVNIKPKVIKVILAGIGSALMVLSALVQAARISKSTVALATLRQQNQWTNDNI